MVPPDRWRATIPEIGRHGLPCAVAAAIVLALPGPATAAAPGAFTAPDDPAVPVLIKSLSGCLAHLQPADRQLLTLRAGLGGKPAALTAAIATATASTPTAVNAGLVTAIRRLEAQRRAGICTPQTAAKAKTPTTPKTTTKKAATPAKTTSSSDSGIGALGIIVPALLFLAFAAGISLEMLRKQRPPGA